MASPQGGSSAPPKGTHSTHEKGRLTAALDPRLRGDDASPFRSALLNGSMRHLILASLNSTCLRTRGSYFRTVIFSVIVRGRSEEHTSELHSLMRISYAVFCFKTKHNTTITISYTYYTCLYPQHIITHLPSSYFLT